MDPNDLRGDKTAPRMKPSLLQKLNFFDGPDTETPLSNGAVLLIYMVAYIALFALVLLFRLILKRNKTRVEACSNSCHGHMNQCFWCLKRTFCGLWCYQCYCPIYLRGDYWVSKTLFRTTGEHDEESGDSCQTCWPCERLSCGCQRPTCHAIGCLCCVIQYRHPPSTTNTHTETMV